MYANIIFQRLPCAPELRFLGDNVAQVAQMGCGRTRTVKSFQISAEI
jgi:hypothetical protein